MNSACLAGPSGLAASKTRSTVPRNSENTSSSLRRSTMRALRLGNLHMRSSPNGRLCSSASCISQYFLTDRYAGNGWCTASERTIREIGPRAIQCPLIIPIRRDASPAQEAVADELNDACQRQTDRRRHDKERKLAGNVKRLSHGLDQHTRPIWRQRTPQWR